MKVKQTSVMYGSRMWFDCIILTSAVERSIFNCSCLTNVSFLACGCSKHCPSFMNGHVFLGGFFFAIFQRIVHVSRMSDVLIAIKKIVHVSCFICDFSENCQCFMKGFSSVHHKSAPRCLHMPA